MNKARTERLIQWYNGELEDKDLSVKDVVVLEKRVFAAISAMVLARDDVHTFTEHRTIQ